MVIAILLAYCGLLGLWFVLGVALDRFDGKP
jgi:hypothetical protein